MKRSLWIVLLIVMLLGIYAVAPQSAKAWGPCNGPYGGYAGCSYNGGYGNNYGGYYGYQGRSGYNRVCYWYGTGAYRRLYCTYVRVPAYPISGYYGYGYSSTYNSGYGGSYGMYGGYGGSYGMYGGSGAMYGGYSGY